MFDLRPLTSSVRWPPKGWRDLMIREPELSPAKHKPEAVKLTHSRWEKINRASEQVNTSAIYRPDPPGKDTWGVFDETDEGKPIGDCDDFAVEKLRRLLKLKGFKIPRGALRLAICNVPRNKQPIGHCVLLMSIKESDSPLVFDSAFATPIWMHHPRIGHYHWLASEWPGHGFWWRKL